MPSLTDWLDFIPMPPELPAGKRSHVHFTFRASKREFVLQIKEALQYAGFLVTLDPCGDPVHSPWDSSLDRGLSQSLMGVLAFSEEELDSPFYRTEHEAMMHGRTEFGLEYVPIKLDRGEFPGGIDELLSVSFSTLTECPGGAPLLTLAQALAGQTPSQEAVAFAGQVDEELAAGLEEVRALVKVGNTDELVGLSHSESTAWNSFPLLRCRVAEALISKGAQEAALVVLDGVQRHHPLSVKARQLRATALFGRGELTEALRLLDHLEAEDRLDDRTLSLLGETWGRMFAQTDELWQRRTSRNYYGRAFRANRDNLIAGQKAASLSVYLGEGDVAATFAIEVMEELTLECGEEQALLSSRSVIPLLILGRVNDVAHRVRAAMNGAPEVAEEFGALRGEVLDLIKRLSISDFDRKKIEQVFQTGSDGRDSARK